MLTKAQSKYIGRLLRELRAQSGMSGTTLAAKAELSQSKISKIENGYSGRLEPAQITRILNILEAAGTIRQQIQEAFDSPALYSGGGKYKQRFRHGEYIQMERQAKVIRVYTSNIVPAVLQTIAYRQAVLDRIGLSPQQMQSAMAESLLRQDLLWEPEREYILLMHEASLYTQVGDSDMQRVQLDRLERMIGARRLSIGVIPVSAGLLVAEAGSFVLYDSGSVWLTAIYSEEESLDSEMVSQYGTLFNELAQKACYGDEAVQLIRRAQNLL